MNETCKLKRMEKLTTLHFGYYYRFLVSFFKGRKAFKSFPAFFQYGEPANRSVYGLKAITGSVLTRVSPTDFPESNLA